MKTFKKSLSLFLCVCLFASIAVVAAFPASANYGDELHRPLVTDIVKDVDTNTFYFYMPEAWRNELNDTYDGTSLESCKAGIYWWEGTGNCEAAENQNGTGKGWPGYVIPDTDPADSNIFVVDVPVDAYTIIFNNTVDGGSDQSSPDYVKAIQTANIGTEFYSADEDGYGFYPEGTDSFNGMIYVCNPKNISVNEYSGKETYNGVWFYYYGNGEYGINKERVEGEVYSNGQFPPYGLQVDETATVEVGAEATISCNDNAATAEVADPSVVELVKNEETGVFTIKGLKTGTTTVKFSLVKEKKDENGETTTVIETAECTVTVTEPVEEPTTPPATQPAPTQPSQNTTKPATVAKVNNPIKVTVAAAKKLTVKIKKGKKATTKKTTLKAITVKNNKAGKVTYTVATKDKKKVLSLKSGKIVVKKGAKKGTYTIKVKVATKATTKYKAFSKTVTIKVKVKK
ncbi:MAG: hypothetical protein J1E96_07005 [Ruminococcus sp.]|nr:hypothetical protein [Ruminococcus sp.]